MRAAAGGMMQGTAENGIDRWQRVKARLLAELGQGRFNAWIAPLTLIGTGDGAVTLSAPSAFARDYARREFADRMLTLWRGEDASIRTVSILAEGLPTAADAQEAVAGPDAAMRAQPLPLSSGVTSRMASGAPAIAPAPRQAGGSGAWTSGPGAVEDGAGGSPLLPHLTFESFVVAKSNQVAFAAAQRVAEAVNEVPYSPLYLYGPVGLGKTHLMHAIGWEILRRDPSKRVVYLSAERFMYHFVNALRYKDTTAFKQAFRSVDVLMVDDVQFIGGKDSTQEEFFHTFNALVDANRQVVVSADRSPKDLEGIEERIRSRLGHGLACQILPTEYELRLGILQAKADALAARYPGVTLTGEVLEFLARTISASVRELEGALTTLMAHAELTGGPLTIAHAQDILRHLVNAAEKRITIDDIQRAVAEYYNLRLVDMSSPRRSRSVARPRQVAMYLCKQITTRSLPEIGRKFGGRDHTTVLHGVKKIEQLRAEDKSLDEDIEVIRRIIEG